MAKKTVKKKTTTLKKNAEVSFTVDGKLISAQPGDNLLEVLNRNGYQLHHLCYHPRLKPEGRCRMCVVEIEGARTLVASCTAKVQKDMVVKTKTPRVLDSRKTTLSLILSNHNLKCMICPSNLNCKLQNYAEQFNLKDLPFTPFERKEPKDLSNTSIIRDNSKCILCGRCVQVCNDIQTVYAIGMQNRGHETKISSPFNQNLEQSNCVNCGQCVILCPVGALSEKSQIDEVDTALKNKEKDGKTIIVQTAPSVRAAIAECFGAEPGQISTGKMVAALRALGFDKVFDTDLAADLTIVEEANEFKERLQENKNLPMITSCCPGWVKFAESYFPHHLHHLSTCKSPQAMMSSVIKKIYAQKEHLDPKKIIVVDIMPCTAKKYEAKRPEFNDETDYVLTTVELGKLIKMKGIDFLSLEDEEFDKPLGESTGAGVIFGRSGGVMEAALRTAADWLSGTSIKDIEYHNVRGMDTWKEAELKIKDQTIKICVVHTLKEARKVMELIQKGEASYHFIEVMACYGGCIGGGGQPRYETTDVVIKRAEAIKKEDEGKKKRKSHENTSVKKLYKDYFGSYGSKKSHELLHTKYTQRDVL